MSTPKNPERVPEIYCRLYTNRDSDRVPQGGDEGVSSGRMPVKGRDKDGDEGTFLETACKGRRDHLGEGKPPSSKMPTMRHASPVAVSKWPS